MVGQITLYTSEVFHIKQSIIFCMVYHVISLDGKWVHGTSQVKEVWYVQILMEDISGRQLRSKLDTWYFSLHVVWNWDKKVAWLILCPPCQMFYKYKAHGKRWWGLLEVWIGLLSCIPSIFLLYTYFTHINLMEVLWVSNG